MKAKFKISLLAVYCFALFSLTFMPILAQETSEDIIDSNDNENIFEDIESPVFNEIVLSKGQITAIDTSGYDWYFDFDQDIFVEGYYSDNDPNDEDIINDEIVTVYDRCTNEKYVKDFEGDIIVGYDEYVDGDIKTLDRISIKGWVRGDVRSINDSVIIFPSGQVDGDVRAPWIIQKKGSKVKGKVVEMDTSLDFRDITSPFSGEGLVVAIVFTVVLMFFSFLATSLMPVQLNRMKDVILKSPVKSYLLGFLFILLMPIITAIVIITIVGIIVAPLVPISYIIAFFIGVVLFGNKIGRMVSVRFLGGEKKMMFQATIGVFLFMSLWLLDAILLGQQSDVAEGFGIFVLVVAIIISTFPICTGVGAAILTRFGFRDYISWKEKHSFDPKPSAPAPPPLRKRDDNNMPDQPDKDDPDFPEKTNPPDIPGESF